MGCPINIRGNLHNFEIHDLFSYIEFSVDQFKGRKWVGTVESMLDKRNEYGGLVGKPERKREIRRPRH